MFFFAFSHIVLFICFWLCWVFTAVQAFPLVAGAALWLWHTGSPCGGFSLLSTGSRAAGFRSLGRWAQQSGLPGSREQAQQLWPKGLAAPWHVGSSQIRNQTHVSSICRWILPSPERPSYFISDLKINALKFLSTLTIRFNACCKIFVNASVNLIVLISNLLCYGQQLLNFIIHF